MTISHCVSCILNFLGRVQYTSSYFVTNVLVTLVTLFQFINITNRDYIGMIFDRGVIARELKIKAISRSNCQSMLLQEPK